MIFLLHLYHPLTTLAWLCWSLLPLVAIVSAQQQRPVSTCCMAYTTINEKTLYVLGGVHYSDTDSSSINTTQFYSLDLTQSGWNTSFPPWKAWTYPSQYLPLSNTRSAYSISVSPDNRSFSVWSSFNADTLVNYTIGSDTWTPVPITDTMDGVGLHATTDPTTGLVYIPVLNTGSNDMRVFNFAANSSTLGPSAASLVSGQAYYSFVWNQVRKSFILFTGTLSATPNPFFEFSPSTGQWTKLDTSGPTPPIRLRSCMASAYNGTKVILYGGDDGSTASSTSIFILDVPSMTWIEGPRAPDARSEMACSVAGDNFIVWGGYRVFPLNLPRLPNFGVPTEPLIYNLHIRQWTTTFVLRTPATTQDEITGGGSNTAVIGGGIAGAVVVIAIILFLIIRRRRQHRHQHVGTKEPESALQNDHSVFLPSMENTHSGAVALSEFSQRLSNDQLNVSDPKRTNSHTPENIPSSSYPGHTPFQGTLPAWSPTTTYTPTYAPTYDHTFTSSPTIPPRPATITSQVMPEDLIQPVYQQPQFKQGQVITPQSSNPQYDPAADRTRSFPIARGPQATEEQDSTATDQELLEQINSLQAQWIRRQAKNQS